MMLPNGWKKVKLGDVANVFDGTHQTPVYVNQGVPFVSVENIEDVWGTDKFITQEAFDAYPEKPQKGDILMTRITAGVIGRTAIIDSNEPLAYYVSLALIRNSKGEFVSEFLSQFIEGCFFKSELNKRIIHTAFPKKINLNDIGKCEVILPPLEEQKKIAATLSVWDSAIEKMEKLIEAKESGHAFLMNEMLKNSKTWDCTCLSDIATIKKGKQLNAVDMISDGAYYVMNGGITPSGNTDDWNTAENTISISEGGNSCGFVAFNKEKFWAGGHCYTLIDLNENISVKFLFHYLKNMEKEIMAMRVGSGLPNIQKDSISDIKVFYPSKKGQERISGVLDDSLSEIALLKQQLENYKKQKQGLMQKLLAGEWRVK